MEAEIPVRDVMTRPVITIDSQVDVAKAAKKMFAINVGSLIVVRGGKPMGILTERDLVGKVVAKSADPKAMTVEQVMSSPLIVVSPEASLREAANLMLKSGVKRLPVISEERGLVGIITDTDLVSGSTSMGLDEIMSHLIETHRESVRLDEPTEMIRGICERCGQITDTLEEVSGELLCWSCRDSSK